MRRRKRKRSLHRPRLFYTPCDPHQAGALLHTNREYAKLDPERRLPKWRQWLFIRDRWITLQESIHGKNNLTCAICGKTGLKGFSKSRTDMATIDHIKPVSVFPELWNDPSNFQVACYRCNQNKGCSC